MADVLGENETSPDLAEKTQTAQNCDSPAMLRLFDSGERAQRTSLNETSLNVCLGSLRVTLYDSDVVIRALSS